MMKKVLYFMVMALFIAYLILSNNIVAELSGNHFVPVKSELYLSLNQNVSFAFDSMFDEDKSIFERVSFNGWSYCNGSVTNEKKESGILLLDSRNNCYLFKGSPNYNRPDIEKLSGEPGVHGFDYAISTILLPPEKYTVYVYCCDDGENPGIMDSGYLLNKGNERLSLNAWSSSEVIDLAGNNAIGDMNYCIDKNEMNSQGYALINGWAYIPEKDTFRQNVFLLLTYADGTKVVYDTKRVSRPDVAEAFSNGIYTMSGFSAKIPADILKSKVFEVAVLVMDADGLHTSPEMLPMVQEELTYASK